MKASRDYRKVPRHCSESWRTIPACFRVLYGFSLALLFSLPASLTAQTQSSEQPGVKAGPDSWSAFGFFSYASGVGTDTCIHLVKVRADRVEVLFTKRLGRSVKSPICLQEAVIAISADGTIEKLSYKGEQLFACKLSGLVGALGHIGRVDDARVFATETVFSAEVQGWRYLLHIIDVSGSKPSTTSTFAIIQPTRVIATTTELIVVGIDGVVRFEVPKLTEGGGP